MTTNTDPVRALIGQWRDAAEFFKGDAGSDIRETLMACASELEAALAQQPAAVGMTKRELFTIAAIHTLRAGDYAKWEHLAQDAVSLADATLAALAAQQGGRADG